MKNQYNIAENIKGVVITGVKNNSLAFNEGLRVGDVISQISQINVENAAQAEKVFRDFIDKKADLILLQVFQNGFPRFLPFKLN